MAELCDLRKEIDALDREIKELFLKRLELSRAIGVCKKENGLPVHDPEREKAVLEKLTDGLSADDAASVKALYEKIFEISKDLQR